MTSYEFHAIGARMLLALVLTLSSLPPWEQLSQAEGVTVFRRKIPGNPYVSMKGIGVIDAPLHKVATVLLDDARLPEWVDDIEAKVVRVISENEYIEYNHVKMPPLVTDREFVTDVSLAIDPQAKMVVIISEPADDPSLPKTKRIRGELHANYVMQAVDATHTRVTIEVTTNPKGLLPAWLVNYFQKDWALATIRGIRKQCAKNDIVAPAEFAAFLAQVPQ